MVSQSASRSSVALSTRTAPAAAIGLRREVLAPGDDGHAEGPADRGDTAAIAPRAHDRERAAREVGVDNSTCHPPARSDAASAGMRRAAGVDQRAGQFRRAVGGGAGGADDDAACRVAARSREALRVPVEAMDLSLGRALQHGGRQRRALAHHADGVEAGEPLHQRRGVVDMVAEHRHPGPRAHRAPVGAVQGRALIIVQNRDLDHAGTGRGMPPRRRGGGRRMGVGPAARRSATVRRRRAASPCLRRAAARRGAVDQARSVDLCFGRHAIAAAVPASRWRCRAASQWRMRQTCTLDDAVVGGVRPAAAA